MKPAPDKTETVVPKNWIVISGRLLDSTQGGGFEFLGPFTEHEATTYAEQIRGWHRQHKTDDAIVMAVQLLRAGPRILEARQ